MKPHNQLGEMAQSFDRMTESIASLLANVAEKERLQSEIEIAASIQRNLLPKEGPQFRGVSFSAHFEPTASIGGDYYDVFNLDKSRLAVAIGDVSGHGLSTGLVMAMVKAAITTLVEEGAEETSLFHRLNDLVYRSTERRAFMTLAFTIFDLERGTIRHTNAGHLYPYLLREGRAARRSRSSRPPYRSASASELVTRTVEVDLREGDTIVYLSDGIVEAQDRERRSVRLRAARNAPRADGPLPVGDPRRHPRRRGAPLRHPPRRRRPHGHGAPLRQLQTDATAAELEAAIERRGYAPRFGCEAAVRQLGERRRGVRPRSDGGELLLRGARLREPDRSAAAATAPRGWAGSLRVSIALRMWFAMRLM